ncbi:MAG: hypothetical protein ACYSWP_08505 [Planctomycetota bacterium]
MAIMYGACCGTFWKSYRKRGMWLLALSFALILIPFYLLLVWMSLVAETKLWWAIDVFLATSILGMILKLLFSVIIYNRSMWHNANIREEKNGH